MGMRRLVCAVFLAASALVSPSGEAQERQVNVKVGPNDQRPAMRWLLTVSGGGLPRPQIAQVAEYEEGDVPMPTGTPWTCKWEAASAFRDRQMLPVLDAAGNETGYFKKADDIRVFCSLRCSADSFKTWTSHTGMYMFTNGVKTSDGSIAEMNVYGGANAGVYVELRPCPLSGPQPMFCPTQVSALKGKPVSP